MTVDDMKSLVAKVKILGLQIRPAAARILLEYLEEAGGGDPNFLDEIMSRLKSELDRLDLNVPAVDEALAALVVRQMSSSGAGGIDPSAAHIKDPISVMNVLVEVPKLTYDQAAKVFRVSPDGRHLLAKSQAKAKMFRDRYKMLLDRVLRSSKFASSTDDKKGVFGKKAVLAELTPVESLLGNPGYRTTFGLITRLEADRLFLEDPHKAIPINIDNATFNNGFYSEGCFVVCEGEMVEGMFHVHIMVSPPAVPRAPLPGDANHFGGSVSLQDLALLEHYETEDDMCIAMSDVHLDDAVVLGKVERMLQGYSDSGMIPRVIILMGDFMSLPFTANSATVERYRKGFSDLAEVLERYPDISQSSKIVMVPGPNDPGPDVLPKPPIADFLTCDITSRFSNVILTSNPCRIRHFSKEITVSRLDITRLLQAGSFSHGMLLTNTLPDKDELMQATVRTIADQGHLCPVPYKLCPTYWEYDHAMYLYPLPHVVILGDSSAKPFHTHFENSYFCNAGSFSKHGFSFYAFFPSTNEFEVSSLD